MKKKIIVGTIVIGLVLATIGVYFIRNITEKTVPQEENNNQSIKVVNVDRIISAPDHYKGFLGVEGIVIKIDEDKSVFLLGCEDACIFIPVKYKGQMPEPNSEIIVYGEIKKQEDGRYVFEGNEVKKK